MQLTDFTTFGDIRAVLGVSEDELQDGTLSLDVYWFGLSAELDEMDPSPLSSYEALYGTAQDQMSEAELRFYRAARLFATYSVARHLLTSLPMFGPKEVSDGKASMTRFALDPYKETIKRVESQWSKALQRLEAALATLTLATAPVTTFRSLMAVSSPTRDPVTGT